MTLFRNLKSSLPRFGVEWLVVFLAVALQVQVTLFAQGDYLGIRVGLADLFIPLIGVGVLFSLVTKRSAFPKFAMPFTVCWLLSLVMVMSVSVLNGYIVTGAISSWAFVNKYIGFYLLVSYFLLGAWIVTNCSDVKRMISLFVRSFCAFFILTLFFSVVTLYLQPFVPFALRLPAYPWDGFMANRNAFMVVFVCVFIFLIWGMVGGRMALPKWLQVLFWLCLPVFCVFNDSRTGWIAIVVLSVVLLLHKPFERLRFILPIVLVGVVLSYGSYYMTTHSTVLKGAQAGYLVDLLFAGEGGPDYVGDRQRVIAVEDGLELYQKSDPLVGAGLGSYKPFQIEKRGEFINIMDFTGLWLLVETGAVGLFVFFAFFAAAALTLFNHGFIKDQGGYYRAMFVFLILFGGMSVLHELMYTRFLWFAMGLALAVPVSLSVSASARKDASAQDLSRG